MKWILQEYNLEFRILIDIVIAGALAGVVGFEREKLKKPAGLRTNMIVSSISCFFVAISSTLINYLEAGSLPVKLTSDPIRIIQAIVVGISFLGAGTILKSNDKNRVYYLTTAATLLYSSAIGISVAVHKYILAIGLSVLILIINFLLNRMDKFLSKNKE